MINRRKFLTFGLSVVLLPVMLPSLTGCTRSPNFTRLPRGSAVVALGDSLTFGYGADSATQSYPVILAQKTGWQIDNMGVNGDTTADVLKRLDTVIAKKPKLVLLGIGGNDVLRRVNASETKDNLVQIIIRLQEADIAVVLIAEPHLSASALFGKASDNPVYKEVASEMDIPLLSNAWSKVLSDNSLKSDQIHANQAGYARFAEMLHEFLQDLGYA